MVTQPGKHDWPFAAQAFAASLPWLASTLGTPDVEPVQLPTGQWREPHLSSWRSRGPDRFSPSDSQLTLP